MEKKGAIVMTHDEAIIEIATHIDARDAFVFTVPSIMSVLLSERIADIDFCCYFDGGDEAGVLYVDKTQYMVAAGLTGAPSVLVVPKTVPAATLAAILDHEIPEDGSKDVFFLSSPESDFIAVPNLFSAAMDKADPEAAELLRANYEARPEAEAA